MHVQLHETTKHSLRVRGIRPASAPRGQLEANELVTVVPEVSPAGRVKLPTARFKQQQGVRSRMKEALDISARLDIALATSQLGKKEDTDVLITEAKAIRDQNEALQRSQAYLREKLNDALLRLQDAVAQINQLNEEKKAMEVLLHNTATSLAPHRASLKGGSKDRHETVQVNLKRI